MISRYLLQKYAGLQRATSSVRHLSTTQPQRQQQQLTTLEQNPTTGVATLSFNNPPANALSLEFLQQIRASIEQLDAAKCRGLIITAAGGRIFCAGLNLNEAYQQEEQHLIKFWTALQDMWKVLFSTPIPTVALVNGHATAGGCMIATCCDYRVALPNFMIGMNETRAGVAVPKWVMDTYENVVPSRRKVEYDLLTGQLYPTEEALQFGLVDALAPTKEEGLQKCMQFLDSYKKVVPSARARTKLAFRERILQDFERSRQADVEQFLTCIQRPEVQQFLGEYLQSLKKKSKK